MTPSLADVQQQFAKALHYEANGEACHIVSDHFSADERIQIYRNNFIISLSEVLEATYPMTLELVGAECFTQLARHHVLNQPLQYGDVTHYGDAFSQTIEQFPTVLEAAPYLTEVTRFEWCLDRAQQMHGQPLPHEPQVSVSPQPLASLAQVSPDAHAFLKFHLSPSVTPFTSSYSLFSLSIAMQSNELEGLDINQPEVGVIACHSNGEAWSSALNQAQYQLLVHLQAGALLSEIEESLLLQLESIISLNLVIGFTIDNLKEPHHE